MTLSKPAYCALLAHTQQTVARTGVCRALPASQALLDLRHRRSATHWMSAQQEQVHDKHYSGSL